MYAEINGIGRVTQMVSAQISPLFFDYVYLTDAQQAEIGKAFENGQVITYKDGAFAFSEPRRGRSWESVRVERNGLLELADVELKRLRDDQVISGQDLTTEIREVAIYRQELRDIPQTYSNPDDVVFPTSPL